MIKRKYKHKIKVSVKLKGLWVETRYYSYTRPLPAIKNRTKWKKQHYNWPSFLYWCSHLVRKIWLPDKTAEQISATYQIEKDVAYGTDSEQNMDIYLSKEAKSYGKNNYTIVFLHGGAYYLSDKREEERYIEPYLKKGLNVVNMNYRLKRGIPMATTDLTNALNYLKANNSDYNLNLKNIIVTGFLWIIQ